MIPVGFLAMALMIAAIWIAAKITGTPVFGNCMMALSTDASIIKRDSNIYSYPVYQSTLIYEGAIVALNSTGYAIAGATTTGLIVVGIARSRADNSSGSSGDINVDVEEGVFQVNNSSSGDAIAKAQIGDACYLVDDCTVAKTSGTSTRSIAGQIKDVNTDGVFVEFRNTLSVDGDLVAANNLSDVANAGTARANIAANKVVLQIPVTTLVGTGVYRVVTPVAGTISVIKSVIDGVLTTGDATLTGKIGTTAITTGVLTIANAGSAAGDVDTCSPSALNVVAAGDVISVTVGGSNATASGAMVSIEIDT